MSGHLRVALAQIDLMVGDVEGNADKIVATAGRARDEQGAQLVVFPELGLTGYPPEDLLFRTQFMEQVEAGLHRVCAASQGIHVLLGLPLEDHRLGRHNAAILLRDGHEVGHYFKQVLPNYSVFDEKRYFVPGREPLVADVAGVRVGVTICEDIWQPEPAAAAARAGAQVLVNLNASPFHYGKHDERMQVLGDRITETGLPIVYVNLVGGQDELVFDGESLAMSAEQALLLRAPSFEQGLFTVDVPVAGERPKAPPQVAERPGDEANIYHALVLGTRDYVAKNGFDGVVMGLSGGIDSSVTLAVAVDALGADQVEAVMMPSRYTADMSRDDAAAMAEGLGVRYRVIPIGAAFDAFLGMLAEEFAGREPDVTEENIQARCRGIVLMAISNKTGRMLLSTGNKSEMAVGYATLYGDMAGGFAPLKDVSKTWVYRLARYRNSRSPVIPERVLTRPPSAELAPDQTDQDALPAYEVLDPILERFVERDGGIKDLVAEGYDEAVVNQVARMVLRAEYKRRQAPPGVRVTQRSFGKDRRYPITSGYGKIFR